MLYAIVFDVIPRFVLKTEVSDERRDPEPNCLSFVKSLREAAYLTVDGQVGIATHSEDPVRMRKAGSFVELVRPPANIVL